MSLPVVIREILNEIGLEDSCFRTETPDLTLSGPLTPESIALADTLRSLIVQFQEMQQQTAPHSPSSVEVRENAKPVTKLLKNVNETDTDDEDEKHICLSCGQRLDATPLTPEETNPIVDSGGGYTPKSVISS